MLTFTSKTPNPVMLVNAASEEAEADTLEVQLNKIDGLFSEKLKTIGISSATILSSILAIARGNIKLAGVMLAIGLVLGFYLVNCKWYKIN
ncbi:hypothetical protein OTSUT76_1393 [Orientia tsutsugamushi str. UT76]|uniref:Uncharacterized protein n=1 Tax=Orientia tsutsugamushi TaxID=784 RepID=A0A2U3QZM2_ORITS|nr:hypothetical protein [Orientia tsutsugamushi]KJV76468.1 hypothetical protein OTSUT76_2512 [Orientia tsutsugamushi str. UT76]KJV88007.1 hypothetical protein OTSUT76_1393 [Orientia tsutsugamushi str. UT76]SPR06435.1 Uncharacterised protein [Orientia tsutsugamushi]